MNNLDKNKEFLLIESLAIILSDSNLNIDYNELENINLDNYNDYLYDKVLENIKRIEDPKHAFLKNKIVSICNTKVISLFKNLDNCFFETEYNVDTFNYIIENYGTDTVCQRFIKNKYITIENLKTILNKNQSNVVIYTLVDYKSDRIEIIDYAVDILIYKNKTETVYPLYYLIEHCSVSKLKFISDIVDKYLYGKFIKRLFTSRDINDFKEYINYDKIIKSIEVMGGLWIEKLISENRLNVDTLKEISIDLDHFKQFISIEKDDFFYPYFIDFNEQYYLDFLHELKHILSKLKFPDIHLYILDSVISYTKEIDKLFSSIISNTSDEVIEYIISIDKFGNCTNDILKLGNEKYSKILLEKGCVNKTYLYRTLIENNASSFYSYILSIEEEALIEYLIENYINDEIVDYVLSDKSLMKNNGYTNKYYINGNMLNILCKNGYSKKIYDFIMNMSNDRKLYQNSYLTTIFDFLEYYNKKERIEIINKLGKMSINRVSHIICSYLYLDNFDFDLHFYKDLHKRNYFEIFYYKNKRFLENLNIINNTI